MKEILLAGGTVPVPIVIVIGFLLVLLCFMADMFVTALKLNDYSDTLEVLKEEKRKSARLQKEIDYLTLLNQMERMRRQAADRGIEAELPKTLPEMQKTLSSQTFSQGAMKKMSKSINEKGVVQEIGFFRLVVMVGLFAALANMVTKAWLKVKHHFGESEDMD